MAGGDQQPGRPGDPKTAAASLRWWVNYDARRSLWRLCGPDKALVAEAAEVRLRVACRLVESNGGWLAAEGRLRMDGRVATID